MIVAVPSKSYFASTKNLTQILMKHPMKLCESRVHNTIQIMHNKHKDYGKILQIFIILS